MKPLAITLGDPAGIGAEVVFKALHTMSVPVRLFGSRKLANPPKDLDFVDVGGSGTVKYGEVSAEYGKISLDSIDAALKCIDNGECSALVTAPINKQAIAAAGSPYAGHTELLAARAGLSRYGHDYAMYFDSPSIRASLLSVHLPLHQAVKSIRAEDIAALAKLTAREYERLYGKAPRMAAAAVNPHGGEGGRFGDEEREIEKGVAAASAQGISITGPHPADTVFRAKYDVVLAMYHDQALIPIKTSAFNEAVNVTIGLPYLRVSVDHGTAFDIAGKNVADPAPMRYAIEWAARVAGRLTP